MAYEYFLLVFNFLFHPLHMAFFQLKYFNFEEVQFTNFSIL